MPEANRARPVLLFLILLLGAAVRLFHLDTQSIWYDESFSIAHSARSLPELFNALIRDAVHPPLHYLILHGWFELAGMSSFQARLISAVFGTASIYLLYRISARFLPATAALTAALLLALSQLGVYFSQEARPYAQLQCLSLLTAWAFLAFLESPVPARCTAFAASAALLLYTHYYGIATLAALCLYWVLFRRQYSPLVPRRLAAVALLVAIAFVPWILALQTRAPSTGNGAWRVERPPSEKPNLLSPFAALTRLNNAKFQSVETNTPFLQTLPGLALFTLPILAALWLTRRQPSQPLVLGILLAAFPVALALAAGTMGMIFNYRHYSFAAPGYELAVASAAAVVLQRPTARLLWLTAAVALSAFALQANYRPTKPDYRTGFLHMAQNYQPGDCVTNRPFRWARRIHYAWEVYYGKDRPLTLIPLDTLPAAASPCARLWLVWDRTWWRNLDEAERQKTESALETLQTGFRITRTFDHPAIKLELRERTAP